MWDKRWLDIGIVLTLLGMLALVGWQFWLVASVYPSDDVGERVDFAEWFFFHGGKEETNKVLYEMVKPQTAGFNLTALNGGGVVQPPAGVDWKNVSVNLYKEYKQGKNGV